MKTTKIIADSLSDIPKKLIESLNITVAPLTIRFGAEEFRDGVDLDSEIFYKKLEEVEEIPSTSQVPPNQFKNIIEESLESGYQNVIIINGSSRVSGTYQSAVIAKNEINNDNVYVFDSLALSYGCGLIVVEAAQMALKNKPINEIIDRINEMIEDAEQIFSVDTLKYLHKNGRLSTGKMALGTLLNVKPILGIIDGKVEPIDKVRGNKKVYKRMIDISRERGLKKGAKVGLGHAGNIEGLEKLKEEVIKEINPSEIVVTDIGCTIGSHTGRGTLLITYIAK